MVLNICTWFCADKVGEESRYTQMRGVSSSKSFQSVYWKNIYIFFLSSKKVNPTANHILFVNCETPVIDGFAMNTALRELGVSIIQVPFEHIPPEGYYDAWRNQFYEFSIFDYISQNGKPDDFWLLLDSDCAFTKTVEHLPAYSKKYDNILTYRASEDPKADINGITREDMRLIYAELSGQTVTQLPHYHVGEFYFSDTAWVQKVFSDFKTLWPVMIARFRAGKKVLTEEAHVLSYIYFKNGVSEDCTANDFVKRMWTNPFIFRNVEPNFVDYAIWHVPYEKRYGFITIYNLIRKKPVSYWLNLPQKNFVDMLKYYLTVPDIPMKIYLFRLLPVQLAKAAYNALRKLKP